MSSRIPFLRRASCTRRTFPPQSRRHIRTPRRLRTAHATSTSQRHIRIRNRCRRSLTYRSRRKPHRTAQSTSMSRRWHIDLAPACRCLNCTWCRIRFRTSQRCRGDRCCHRIQDHTCTRRRRSSSHGRCKCPICCKSCRSRFRKGPQRIPGNRPRSSHHGTSNLHQHTARGRDRFGWPSTPRHSLFRTAQAPQRRPTEPPGQRTTDNPLPSTQGSTRSLHPRSARASGRWYSSGTSPYTRRRKAHCCTDCILAPRSRRHKDTIRLPRTSRACRTWCPLRIPPRTTDHTVPWRRSCSQGSTHSRSTGIHPPLNTFLARCNLEWQYTAPGTRAPGSLPHMCRTPPPPIPRSKCTLPDRCTSRAHSSSLGSGRM